MIARLVGGPWGCVSADWAACGGCQISCGSTSCRMLGRVAILVGCMWGGQLLALALKGGPQLLSRKAPMISGGRIRSGPRNPASLHEGVPAAPIRPHPSFARPNTTPDFRPRLGFGAVFLVDLSRAPDGADPQQAGKAATASGPVAEAVWARTGAPKTARACAAFRPAPPGGRRCAGRPQSSVHRGDGGG